MLYTEIPNCPMNNIAKTKIIATIGPSSWDDSVLRKMFESGMLLARINASFADYNELERVSKQIRNISPRIATILDTQGTKVRVKGLSKETIVKDTVTLSSEDRLNSNVLTITYPSLERDVVVGTRILLDDGNIQLQVREIKGKDVVCSVIQEGILKPNKTVNIPDINLHFPAVTEKDKQDIEYAKNLNFDFVCASFARNKKDIQIVKSILEGSNTKVIAKIENKQGVLNFDEILKESDAIMIARGDLGVELDLEEVPILQKQIIYKCRMAGKPVIVATQMLESMKTNKRPTRAEVSDVANAVMDGADCMMLSAETSTGNFPIEAVQMMNKISLRTENNGSSEVTKSYDLAGITLEAGDVYVICTDTYAGPAVCDEIQVYGETDAGTETDRFGISACKLSEEIHYNAILIISDSKSVVGSVSRHRSSIPIYVVSSSLESIRENTLYRGVTTYYIKELSDDRDSNILIAVEKIYGSGKLDLLDKIAIISGSSIKNKKTDSILEIVTVKDILNS